MCNTGPLRSKYVDSTQMGIVSHVFVPLSSYWCSYYSHVNSSCGMQKALAFAREDYFCYKKRLGGGICIRISNRKSFQPRSGDTLFFHVFEGNSFFVVNGICFFHQFRPIYHQSEMRDSVTPQTSTRWPSRIVQIAALA